MLKEIGNDTFTAEVLQAKAPVLVDFWAEWCTSCKALTPKLEEIATELQGRASIVKVNAEDCPEIAAKYGVRGLPAMVIFKNGQVENALHGNMNKDTIREALSAAL